jgi:hypothetical protein
LHNAGLSIELLLKAACLYKKVPFKKIIEMGHNLIKLAQAINFFENKELQTNYHDLLLALQRCIIFARYPIGKRKEDIENFNEGYQFYKELSLNEVIKLHKLGKKIPQHPIHSINWKSYSDLRRTIYDFTFEVIRSIDGRDLIYDISGICLQQQRIKGNPVELDLIKTGIKTPDV